ncbi:MAG: saccharopine dehydrogenase NADP-binding domain-containing protein [bacterium]|nr:MAG: saccharopine dehydrogenase NADP-binding domain-containing protein [bacterium]
MAQVVIFGAGMVARPLVRYLLDQPDTTVVVATRTVSKAEKMIDGHPQGVAKTLDVKDMAGVEKEVKAADVVVSLLPYAYHVAVAELCLKHKKQMVTTSYVSDEMSALDDRAKETGIIILNECGLDPGIDHMSAMRIIHDVTDRGGKVTSFRSSTGALPSHEANNNPFGYKFSWSPRGVLLASRNSAKWLEDSKEVDIPGEELFENYYILDVPGTGAFENYPNRNSVPYKEIYGLKDAATVYRGTLRMTGWCETMRNIVATGWLQDEPVKGFSGKTFADMTRHLIGAKVGDDIIGATAEFLGIKPYAAIMKRIEWLGLFSDKALPSDKDNPLDYMNVLTLEKMSMEPGDRDMVVMHHEFLAEFPGGEKESLTSTLVDYGIPDGDTSVARTVALPAAIAVKMILNGKINLTGVYVPVIPEIYNPILDELEELGIKFVERKERV